PALQLDLAALDPKLTRTHPTLRSLPTATASTRHTPPGTRTLTCARPRGPRTGVSTTSLPKSARSPADNDCPERHRGGRSPNHNATRPPGGQVHDTTTPLVARTTSRSVTGRGRGRGAARRTSPSDPHPCPDEVTYNARTR